jgi:hypothetical protein
MTTTEAFEASLRAEFESLPEFVADAALLQRQMDGKSYVYTRVQGMWKGYQAATERAAKLCNTERTAQVDAAAANNGRSSDIAFGAVNAAERLAAAIRARDEGVRG